ncbi:MAG: signal peptide peptidase SppA [Bacteroidaceae bacterium]|nr:signal peptide peptidase SppA [Bacteroidaceae bacterium]
MKDFLKFTLATITGLMLVGAILTFFSIVVLVGLIASSEPTVQVKSNSVFVLNLNKPLSERAVEDPITMLMGEDYANIGLNEVLTSIKKAKEEANITGIYLEASGYSDASPAEWEEIRRALMNFKESGKFIVAYGDNYSQGEYYLCSVADKVILNPQGSIEWTGISSQPIFYKRLLEKIGVTMNIFKVGTYKSAIEPFIATEMSEANREQTHAYLNSIWTRITEDIATSRSISTKDLNKYADEMIALSPTERFIEAGMADTLLYKDEVKEYLKKLTHTNSHQSLNTLSLKEMKAIEEVAIFPKNEGRIAVYYAVGEIMDDIPGGTFSTEECIVGSQTIKELSQLREDDQVKAVVLRVNSPGGSAFASEQIWNEVVKLKTKKPVIVSMGGMAASGGYYISCAADSIFAEATTLTGSIGIFGMTPNMEGLLSDKLGLDFDIVKTNRYADFASPTRPMTEGEKALLQKTIERGYDLFVTRCAEGREMSKEALCRVAEGRVWTGEMAKELGLVDQIGGIDEAVKAAAEKAGLKEYTQATYPKQADLFNSLMQSGKERYIQTKLKEMTGGYDQHIRLMNRLKHAAPQQAHIGFDPNVKL